MTTPRILLADAGAVFEPGAPVRGTVTGGEYEVSLERHSSADIPRDQIDVIATVRTTAGAFELPADSVPSYAGQSIRYAHSLVARPIGAGAGAETRTPIRIALLSDTAFDLSFFGSVRQHAPGSWASTIVWSLLTFAACLALLLVAWIKSSGPSFNVLTPLAILAALLLAGVTFYRPWARWRDEQKGWSGPFLGLATEPSFSIPLLLDNMIFAKIEAMYSLRTITADSGFRGGAQVKHLAFDVELGAHCRDVTRMAAWLEVVEYQRVRVQRSSDDPSPQWEDHDTVIHSTGAELTSDGDAPSLWVGTLAIPQGQPLTSKIPDWGGVEWRFSFVAELADGSRRSSYPRCLTVQQV